MNSMLVLHSKQAVRDDAATEGKPRKAIYITLIKELSVLQPRRHFSDSTHNAS